MFDFHEKRKIKSWLYSKPFIALLLIIAGFLSVSAYNRYEIAQETKAKFEAKQQELEELNARAAMLEAKVEHLEDARGIEEELRTRFDVAKEGEEVIVLIDDPVEEDATIIEVSDPVPKPSFFARFKFW